jgi:hypothetical protein
VGARPGHRVAGGAVPAGVEEPVSGRAGAVRGLGHPYRPPSMETLSRRLAAADKPGEHLWIVTVAFGVTDPAAVDRGRETLMDSEAIIMFAGPGCYKCERPYSAAMAKRPCRGSADEVQPPGGAR